ncbi:hypothetical protein QE368_000997 [Asaia bogorensis NBRC 16594]|nr:hypothetical protein [Asaia bogorensis NBRC 16594]
MITHILLWDTAYPQRMRTLSDIIFAYRRPGAV